MTGKKQFTTIDEYISTFLADMQDILANIQQTIRNAVPEGTETTSYHISPLTYPHCRMPAVDIGICRTTIW